MNFYFNDDQKWFIIVVVCILIFIVVLRVTGFHASAGESDYDQAKNMCGSKGVAHFNYDYHAADETEQPDVTCK